MKQFKLHLLTALFFVIGFTSYAQVGIGTTIPNNSAALEIKSTTQGLLPPRMTKVQRDNISMPANGLLVFCTDCSQTGMYFYNGTTWNAVSSGAEATTHTLF